jgi:hypothetical protein
MTSFPAENREIIFSALDDTLKLAITIPHDDPLSFASYIAFSLFPRLMLRSLSLGCKGKHAALAFKTRCDMLTSGRVGDLIKDAHDSQVTRVARRILDITQPASTFPLTTRAASPARCDALGKAC